MTVLHKGLFEFQGEAKRAQISGRPLLNYSRKMLASYILWMDDQMDKGLDACGVEFKEGETACSNESGAE